jgi:hypothetical protein
MPPALLPRLIETARGYNIVRVGDRWYAVPVGVAADFYHDDPAKVPGLLAADSQQQVHQLLVEHPLLVVENPVPRLAAVVGRFNIVGFRGRWYAVPFGVPVDWAKDDLTDLPGVVSGSTQTQVTADAEAKPATP